jgi:hypothetical protein
MFQDIKISIFNGQDISQAAAAWLTASPAIAGCRMLDDDFRIAAAFRLRAPIPIDSLSVLNALPPNQQVCSFCGLSTFA